MIKEIEIGYHFVTVYGSPRRDVHELGKVIYNHIRRNRKDLIDIQQFNLSHEAGDPNVYHPWGNPHEVHKEYPDHFHIRFGRTVNQSDIDDVLMWLSRHVSVSNIKVYSIEDDNKTGIVYPEIQGDYLEWIDWMRTGEWKNGN